MNQPSSRPIVGSIIRASIVLMLLITIGIFVYAVHVCSSAQKLIDSARTIHSSADAERVISDWKKWSDQHSFNERVLPDGNHAYSLKVENRLLNRLRIVPLTTVSMAVTMRNGELQSILVVMFTGNEPNTTAGVWVQEWFTAFPMNDVRVNDKWRPWKATVDLSSATLDAQREKAFALNTKCFVQIRGCRSAEEILPAVWELHSANQGQTVRF